MVRDECNSLCFYVFVLTHYNVAVQDDKRVLLTLWADFLDFLHIVFGAVVDGVSYSTLGDDLMFGGRCRAEDSHILHSLTQLGGSDTHTTYRCAEQLFFTNSATSNN